MADFTTKNTKKKVTLQPPIKLLIPPLNPTLIYAIKQEGIKQEKPHPKLHTRSSIYIREGLDHSHTE